MLQITPCECWSSKKPSANNATILVRKSAAVVQWVSRVPPELETRGSIPCRDRSVNVLPAAWCSEAGHVARTDTTEGQALWQPGGVEEDSCCREGDRHLRLV